MPASWFESSATFRKCTAEKASFILLSQFDLVFTVIAVSLGFTELNPIVSYLIHMPVFLLILKLAIPVLLAWLIPGKLLLPSIALLAVVAVWNIKEMISFLL